MSLPEGGWSFGNLEVDALFQAHPDIVERLCADVAAIILTATADGARCALLLGPAGFRPFSCCPHFLMAWFGAPSAQSTVPGWIFTGCRNLLGLLGSRSVARRVNFYMKHLVREQGSCQGAFTKHGAAATALELLCPCLMALDWQQTIGQDFRRMVHFRAALKAIADAKAARCNLCIGKHALDVWISSAVLQLARMSKSSPTKWWCRFLTPCGAELGSHLTTMVCGMHFCTPFLVMWHVRFDCISTTQYQARPRVLRSGRRSATVHVLQDKLFALCLADGVSICLLCLAGQCTAMMSGSASSSSCLARRFCQKLKRQRSRNLKNVQGLHRYLLLACS